MCGEECPKVCRICQPERFDSNNPDARFIPLKDCGHFIEVTALDQWVFEKAGGGKDGEEQQKSGETVAIVQIPCPKCKTPIRHSYRYMDLLNQRAIDIQEVSKLNLYCKNTN
jgi:hypothetical protein